MQNKKSLIFSTIILTIAILAIVLSLTTKFVYIQACTDSSYPIFDFKQSFNVLEFIREDIFFKYNLIYIFESASGPIWIVVGSIISNLLPLISTLVLIVALVIEIIYLFTKRVLAHNNSFVKPFAIFTGILYLIMCIFCFVGFTINNSMANGYMEFYANTGFYINAFVGLALIIFPIFLGDKQKEPNFNKIKNIILYGLVIATSAIFCIFLFSNHYNADWFEKTTIFALSTFTVQNVNELGFASTGGDIPFGLSQYAIFAIIFCLAFITVYAIIALIRTCANKTTNWLSIRIRRWSIALISAVSVLYFLVICSVCVYCSNIVWYVGPEGYVYFTTVTPIVCFVLPLILTLITRLIPTENKQK